MTAVPRGRGELVQLYRQTSPWHQAVSDALALIAAEMRVTTPVKQIVELIGVSDKRIYQILDEAGAVQADDQRMRRAAAIASLIEKTTETTERNETGMSWKWCGDVQPHAIHGNCPGVPETTRTTDKNGRTTYSERIVETDPDGMHSTSDSTRQD